MAERPMGIETEYGFSVAREGNQPDLRSRRSRSLVALARKKHRHLRGRSDSGVFLENGSRFYIDAGDHPELCTPEVQSPFEVVRFAAAGDRMLAALAADLPADHQALIFKCNVDYVSGNTWASHENYGYRCSPSILPRQLIPHLVSRLIYTGAGGFNPRTDGLEFCLSPRALHLMADATSGSTRTRGIYHDKNESLSKQGWNRMHVLCGESLCSHLAGSLRLGTTALVVALVEAGKDPGDDVQLSDPLAAMHLYCADVSLQTKAPAKNGRSLSALDIQWHFLRCAEDFLGETFMPAWSPRICEVWRDTLERLSNQGVSGVNTRLDWAIKFTLFEQHLERRGIGPEQRERFNRLMTARNPRKLGLRTLGEEGFEAAPNVGGEFPLPRNRVAKKRTTTRQDPEWTRNLTLVRSELRELDVRFSQLGANVFSSMEDAGLLEHTVPEITTERILSAVKQPPDSGRARVRGEMIKTLKPRSKYRCDWYGIWSEDGTWLDLTDPEQSKVPEWVKPGSESKASRMENVGRLNLRMAQSNYDRGSYEAALQYLERCTGRASFTSTHYFNLLSAQIQSRRGYLSRALRLLDANSGPDHQMEYSDFLERVIFHRYAGVAPGSGYLNALDRASGAFQALRNPSDHNRFTFQGASGLGCVLRGDLAQGERLMRRAVSRPQRSQRFPKLFTRIKTDLADVYRRLDRPDDARRELSEAEAIYRELGFRSELTDNVLLRRAKLAAKGDLARATLDQAEDIQSRVLNRLGLVKTHLLRARMLDTADARRSHHQLTAFRDQLPVLSTCALFTRIMDHWDDWVSGQQLLDQTDEFWGL